MANSQTLQELPGGPPVHCSYVTRSVGQVGGSGMVWFGLMKEIEMMLEIVKFGQP